MKLNISIDSQNEAMQTGSDAIQALKRMFRRWEDMDGSEGPVEGIFRDENGNKVGKWEIDLEVEDPTEDPERDAEEDEEA